ATALTLLNTQPENKKPLGPGPGVSFATSVACAMHKQPATVHI
ncbi:MAG: hypothetical protein RL220_1984, partial [Bacteroidota bacterium]